MNESRTTTLRYPKHPGSAVRLEEELLERWRAEDLFNQTLRHTEGLPEFVFFEGPPTANGRPGIHHVLSRTIKDVVCRYQTMRGRHVTRIAGWDTHGLPVEIEAEKRLGISGKRADRGTRRRPFNEVVPGERLHVQGGLGAAVGADRLLAGLLGPYVTFEPRYIESVWWILKQLASAA
jgi:isoleucyl-tRNA synthetase